MPKQMPPKKKLPNSPEPQQPTAPPFEIEQEPIPPSIVPDHDLKGKYSDPAVKEAAFAYVLELMMTGKAVRKILKMDKTPTANIFFKWLAESSEMNERYARAHEVRAAFLFEKMQQIANTPKMGQTIKTLPDGKKEVTTGDMLGHRRLQVDTLKWIISKMDPEKYGDKIKSEVTNRNFNIDASELTPEKIREINQALESKY